MADQAYLHAIALAYAEPRPNLCGRDVVIGIEAMFLADVNGTFLQAPGPREMSSSSDGPR